MIPPNAVMVQLLDTKQTKYVVASELDSIATAIQKCIDNEQTSHIVQAHTHIKAKSWQKVILEEDEEKYPALTKEELKYL